jgi:uncharacterized OB-fold protein
MSEPHIDQEQRQMLPMPGWTPRTEPYWLAAGRGELVVRGCVDCGAQHWPPSEACFNCQSQNLQWAPVAGTGRVFSYTWADWPPPPDGTERNISVIELDSTEGPDPVLLLSWVVDVERDALVCDLPVEVTFVAVDDEVSVPVWRPRA